MEFALSTALATAGDSKQKVYTTILVNTSAVKWKTLTNLLYFSPYDINTSITEVVKLVSGFCYFI